MTFDDILTLIHNTSADPALIEVNGISDHWAQGRTVFGGLSAAMAHAAIERQLPDQRHIRSMAVNFVGPLLTDTPFQIHSEILRKGKNVVHAAAKVMQQDKVCLVVQSCFGFDRDSKINHPHQIRHEMILPKKANFIPQVPKVVPKFLRHFDLAIEKGLPFTGSKSNDMRGWLRFKNAPTEINNAHLIALLDAYPSVALQNLRWPAPASSLSWFVEFIYPYTKIDVTDWLAYEAIARQAAQGYVHEQAYMWNSHGHLVAISTQTVTIFD